MPPTYSYTHLKPVDCTDFDITQNITEDSLKNCPKCNKPVKRIITQAPNFTMQGGTPKFH